jgi:hypothetical protein
LSVTRAEAISPDTKELDAHVCTHAISQQSESAAEILP